MNHTPVEPTDTDVTETVRRKARRMLRARRQRSDFWHSLAHVGVLGWMFVLPLVASVLLGRHLADKFGHDGFALGGLFAGLAAGSYATWKAIRRAMHDVEQDEADAESDDAEEST